MINLNSGSKKDWRGCYPTGPILYDHWDTIDVFVNPGSVPWVRGDDIMLGDEYSAVCPANTKFMKKM